MVECDGRFTAPPDYEFPLIVLNSQSKEKLLTLFHEFFHYVEYVRHPDKYDDYMDVSPEHPAEQVHEQLAKESLEAFLNSYPEVRNIIF